MTRFWQECDQPAPHQYDTYEPSVGFVSDGHGCFPWFERGVPVTWLLPMTDAMLVEVAERITRRRIPTVVTAEQVEAMAAADAKHRRVYAEAMAAWQQRIRQVIFGEDE